MAREIIPFDALRVNPHYLWNKTWMLLTAGDFADGHYNTMTVGWGSLGTMWGRPFSQIVVRPTRFTYKFTEEYDSFTLCAFPEDVRGALDYLGTHSGRDGDKLAEVRLTPIASTQVAAPGFDEAELIIECNKIYWDDMKPEHFVDPAFGRHYEGSDYHRIYYGEIVAIIGEEAYRSGK
ncbi:MAG: flavin reductase family protein [Chloroflexota bacterium]|nr:flavin reductase family protein [Chloroflexota bacterium]